MGAVGPRFVARFHCLADQCEDNCCTGWKIPIDEPHYHAMEAALAGDPRFAVAVKKTGEPNPYALMVLAENGYCHFLEGQLCSLHARFGAEVLGDACASYPRLGSRLGEVVEASLELSCPEAARLCLLHDDAMEMEEVDAALSGRGLTRQSLTSEAQALDAELAAFAGVRETVLELLQKRQYPLTSRLFFVAFYAHQRDRALALHPEVQAQLHRQLEAAPADASLAATILVAILGARLETKVPPVFARLVGATLDADLRHVGGEPTGQLAADLRTLGARRLLSVHRARRKDDLDAPLENYCRHFFYGDWYLRSPSLLVHLNSLLVRLNIIRWLYSAHPNIVEVVYAFSRAVEHNQTLSQTITQAISDTGTTTVAHSAALLKF